MIKNKILLLSENKENMLSPPKEDLLCLFSKSNNLTQEIYIKEIDSDNYLYPKYLSSTDYTVSGPLFIADSATSSLDIAHHLIQKNIFPAFASILCRDQKSGRGQLRRHWSSPEGNIYAALCLPNVPPFSTEAAAPALGGILAHALNTMGYDVFLKWPNDIIQKQADNTWRKVAGVLLEERHNTLIAGIGMNIHSAPEKAELRKDYFIEAGILKNHLHQTKANSKTNNIYTFLQKEAGSLEEIIKNLTLTGMTSSTVNNKNTNNSNMININYIKIWRLWLTLVEQIFLWYKEQELETNSTPWQNMTQKYLAFIGETVRVCHPIIKEFSYQKRRDANYIVGQVCGINSNGELMLQTSNGLITILGGTFSQEDNK